MLRYSNLLFLQVMMMMMTTMLSYLTKKQLMAMLMRPNRGKDDNRYRKKGSLINPASFSTIERLF